MKLLEIEYHNIFILNHSYFYMNQTSQMIEIQIVFETRLISITI